MEKTVKVRVRLTDLQHDGNGWCENGAHVTEATIAVPEERVKSVFREDKGVSRMILASVGATGFKKDCWCGSDFGPWRSGTMGVYADIIDEEEN